MSKGDDIRNRISNEYEKTPGYLLWDFAEAVGQEMELQLQSLNDVAAKLNVDNLTGEELEKFVSQRKGIERKAATYAIGRVTVNGTGTVTKGDLFETQNGVQFAATETVQVNGSGEVPVAAITAGNIGVVGAGSITQMPVTISGINSCGNSLATSDGYDAESDDALRNRYFSAICTPAASGNKYSYRNWALEVPGVGDAQVYPLGHGENTVDIVIIDSEKLPASDQLVLAVQAYIDPDSSGRGEGMAPMGAHCYVAAGSPLEVNISAKLTINGLQAETESKIKESITDYLASIAFSDANISYAQIGNAIISVSNVLDYENLRVNNGNTNIAVPERSVAVLGTVVFTYA